MSLSERSKWATLALFALAAFGLASEVFHTFPVGYGASFLPAMLVGSSIVNFSLQLDPARDGLLAAVFGYGTVAAFFGFSYAVHRHIVWASILAVAFVAFDGMFLFMFGPDMMSGLFASIQLPFHALVCWWIVDSIRASRQQRVNADLVRSMQFEHELKRRLAESDEPPPPAAKFDTRFRGMPPTGPQQPPLGAA